MQSQALEAARDAGSYRLERVDIRQLGPDLHREWSAFLERNLSESPMHHPEWLRDCAAQANHRAVAYLLYCGESLAGIAPFLELNWPLRWQLGEITIARPRLRRLCLLGGEPCFPPDPAVYDLLFRELLAKERDFDAIYMENVPVESFLWRFTESSSRLSGSLARYVPEAPSPRVLLALEGSFEDYLKKFSPKHRQTLKRKVRKLQDAAPGEVRLLRSTQPEQVESFLEKAVAISRQTYQWNLLGGGLSATDKIRKRLSFFAANGWLRSYLLMVKDEPCAFVTGFQYGRRYYLDDMGYAPDWRAYSPGTVLQLQIIEDLFSHNRPDVYDLGEFGTHKEEFATSQYFQGKLFVFRPGFYRRLVRAGHRGCSVVDGLASTILERYGWKARLKKLIRMRSSA